MDELIQKYGIPKNKIWLESGSWQSLDIFKQAGYRTSYYLPYYKFGQMSADEISAAEKRTEEAANSGNIDAVSFYGGYYDFIKRLNLPPDIVFLTWLDGRRWSSVVFEKQYRGILNDDKIKVILVSDYGHYNR